MTIQEQLLRDEGFKSAAYQDSLGFWTIGVGRLIDARKGGGITRDEALYLLGNDTKRVRAELLEHLPWSAKLDEVRFAVLLNMGFNLGVPGLLKFQDALAHIRDGEFDLGAKALLQSRWAMQVGARAQRLATQLKTGIWQ